MNISYLAYPINLLYIVHICILSASLKHTGLQHLYKLFKSLLNKASSGISPI